MFAVYKKIFALLDRRERRRFFQLMALSVLMGVAEAVGVASILPFLALVAAPENVSERPELARLQAFTGLTSPTHFLIALGLAAFAAIVASQFLKGVTFYALNRFSMMRTHTLAMRLLGRYMAQPYAWFLTRHSADLSKTLLAEVAQVVTTTIIPAMRVMARGAVVLFLVALVVLVDPVVAISGGLAIGAIYAGLLLYTRRHLDRIGEERIKANRERYRLAGEMIGGVKDVKLLGLEHSYLMRFAAPSERMALNQAKAQVYREMPRYVLEAALFGGMLLLVIALMAQGRNIQSLIPTLGLYAFAGARLFPAMQTLYADLNAIRFGGAALNALIRDFAATPDALPRKGPPPAPLRLTRELALDQVRYAYPKADRAALEGLSLDIRANSIVGVVGGTGAGKSTLVDVMLGLLTPQSGRLMVDGAEVGPDALPAWRRSIGYVPQQIFLVDASIAANIAFGVPEPKIDRAALERAARIAELHDFVMESLPQGYETSIGERGVRLSGGQRQRIGIARALYHDPDVLILDEATSALDNVTEKAVMDAVRNLGRAKTIVMVAHRLSTIRDCDELFLIEHGQVAARGSYDQLVESNESFRRMAQGG